LFYSSFLFFVFVFFCFLTTNAIHNGCLAEFVSENGVGWIKGNIRESHFWRDSLRPKNFVSFQAIEMTLVRVVFDITPRPTRGQTSGSPAGDQLFLDASLLHMSYKPIAHIVPGGRLVVGVDRSQVHGVLGTIHTDSVLNAFQVLVTVRGGAEKGSVAFPTGQAGVGVVGHNGGIFRTHGTLGGSQLNHGGHVKDKKNYNIREEYLNSF
jgi:hypothetical protein